MDNEEIEAKLERGKTSLPGDGRAVSLVGDIHVFKAVVENTDGNYALFEARVPLEGEPPPHIPKREEEGFNLLE